MSSSIARDFFLIVCAVCQFALPCMASPAEAQQKSDSMLVYGQDFVFSLKEPNGWIADTQSAEKFEANVVLCASGKLPDDPSGLIRIMVNDKVDENTSADLKGDIREYKAKYPNIQLKDIVTDHRTYRCFAKVFYLPGQFYEYVAYVNPGSGKPLLFSVSMNVQKTEASEGQLEAFKSTIRSLTLLKP